jgi:hypothetical protein
MIAMIATVVIAVVMMLVARYILPVVPIVANEIHGTAAGIVFGAVLRPMPLMTGWHVEIHRFPNEGRIPVNHNGTRIDQHGRLWHITDIDLPEEAGLTHIDGHSDVGRHGRRGGAKCKQ